MPVAAVAPLRLMLPRVFGPGLVAMLLATAAMTVPQSVQAQVSPFTQSVAIAASEDEAIAAFYAARNYAPVWTDAGNAERRNVLLTALTRAGDHGLPVQRYDAGALADAFRAARTEGDRGRLEVRMTRAFLDYARDLNSGVLVPKKVDPGIVREIPVRSLESNLAMLTDADLSGFLAGLAPTAPAYAQLMKAKIQIEAQIARGGWGDALPTVTLKPGASGEAVVALRDRLVAMGYLGRSATRSYDDTMEKAVQQFQLDHGLQPDGVLDDSTLAQINVGPEARLQSILVAMERERWINIDRGRRHIWVNLTDFSARIMDDGKETFATRSVIGKDVPDQRTPEFSDTMDYMVINPSWSVPRSITTKEYLPLLKKNPNAAGHLKIVDSKGRVVDRGAINFGKYTAANFPFAMRQPPSDGNALGLVKFMFPNPYNIYLHDTPSKSLFERETRAFSHGCIRLGQPFDFAYALLARQSDDPKATFHQVLDRGAEAAVRLEQPVPVHIVYFTAFPGAKGKMNYRRDVYGRDGLIFDALMQAGVVLGGHQG
ncbi:L,D-transpeptidase family protein [Gemmobacter fulvus]|uniref:L,D-transpeptidase family protein n=1 Tax=Gemmobacter fulvus TaxID=2840474 RepID=UPI002796697E|nr:L,D-transpeptidase family protein [Gemmobacter fulvus]MDQ1847984.1 L,D-transpeptidase family protein [Gemmobacter fulvus]